MASNSAIVGILRALLTAETAQFETAMKRSSETARQWSRDLRQIGTQATQLGSALTKSFTVPIVAGLGSAAKAAIDFESSFAGVRKTVEATEPEFQAMAEAFRNLAKQIPVNVNELNRLGEAAGALGIPKKEIVDFARVMALLGVTTNVTSDQAASSIAKIQNVFQAAGKETENFASTLVDLGNKGASTEAEILELAQRIASAGAAVGMSQAQVLGFASAIANVGIEAEAGGTAISKVFSDISIAVSHGGKALEDFARVARMSGDDFSALFKKDAASAVLAFVEGLGKAKAEGQDLNIVLEELGFKEVRQARALRDLALSGKNLGDSLKTASNAWRENTALSKEAQERFKTTESQLTILWNRLKDVGITIGNALKPAIDAAIKAAELLIPVIDTAGKIFAALPTPLKLGAAGILAIAAAIGPLIYVAGQLITSFGLVAGTFAKGGIAARGLAAANDVLAASNLRLAASFRTLLIAGGALAAGAAGIVAAWEIQKNAAKQITDQFGTLAEVEAEIAKREAEIARLRQDPDARREVPALKEALEALKAKRDALKNVAAAQAEVNRATTEGMEFQGPMPSGASAKRMFADSIAAANKQIQEEIKNTKLSMAELLKMLDQNEVAFKAGAKAMGLNAETVQFLEQQLQKHKKATTDSREATEKLNKSIDDQQKKLEALGIITKDKVNEEFHELNQLWSRALAEGVPLEAVVRLLGPAYQDLADKAKKSNVELKSLNETLALQKTLLPTPKLDSLTLIGGGTASLMKVGLALKDITAESLEATRQSVLMKGAYEAFGLKTREELQRTARQLREYYNDLVTSGKVSAKDLEEARQKVLEAERAAAGETVSIWKSQVAPAIKDVMGHLTDSVNGAFAQMLLGAKGFGAGFLDILKSLAAAAVNMLNAVLSSFMNQLFKGVSSALSGQGFGKAFSGLSGLIGLGSSAAGAAVPGLAVSGLPLSTLTVPGGGAGLSGAFGAAGGGISSAALIGLTAGIGAAIVAGFALYSRQNNVTAKSREKFASELGFQNLGALYKSLQGMGPRGEQLANTGLNVIGRKDTAANQQWMKDVTAFMEAVKNFSSIVTSATGNITAGFTSKLSATFKTQTEDQLKLYDEQIEAARDNADEVTRLEGEKAQFIKDSNTSIVASSQTEFDRLNRIILGSYDAARAQGQSQVQAIQTVGAAIDSQKASADRFGFAVSGAFQELLRLRDFTTANAPILDSIAGLTDLAKILGDTNRLNQQMFSDLQAQGLETYQALIAAGATEAEAREAVTPLIEEEIRLAKEKKLKIDEGTQALIDQMRANGELKTEQQSLVDVFKEGFGALLKFLKVDLPAGWQATADAAGQAARDTERHWSGIRIKVPVDYEAGEFPGAPGGGSAWVPGAAEGGLFMRPSIIGIGEAGPEAAIPLDRLHEFTGESGRMGADRIVNHIHVNIEGRQAAEAVVPFLTPEVKRLGYGHR